MTIYSVAKLAGVSIATVSRVLGGTEPFSASAREKVLGAVQELDYVPQHSARSLASRRYGAHAVVTGSLSGPYYPELIMGYEAAAASHGLTVMLLAADTRRDPIGDLLALRGSVDGVMVAHNSLDAEAVRRLGESFPVVTVGRNAVPGCDLVLSESLSSATTLTTHLIEHGRNRLVFVGEPGRSADSRGRYDGYLAAHRTAGLQSPSTVFPVPFTESAGRSVVERLVALRHTFDGIVCMNDELALAIMQGLQRHGVRVPEDVAIVGWDDVATAKYVTPGLTTVRQPVRELGALAVAVLQGRIAGDPAGAEPHLLACEVVIRASCGCGPR